MPQRLVYAKYLQSCLENLLHQAAWCGRGDLHLPEALLPVSSVISGKAFDRSGLQLPALNERPSSSRIGFMPSLGLREPRCQWTEVLWPRAQEASTTSTKSVSSKEAFGRFRSANTSALCALHSILSITPSLFLWMAESPGHLLPPC